MSSRSGARPAGSCLRCAYFGLQTKATTNLSDNPMYGAIYCQECADYLIENFPPGYRGDRYLSSQQTPYQHKEAT